MTTGSSARVVLVIAALASPAIAEEDDTALEAKELFEEGKRLLAAGKIEKACAKLENSERLVPADGTQLNLALCWEKLGKTASAWNMFVKLAGTVKREDRAAEARKKAKELEKQLVHLTIEVPAESELDDLVIARNDKVVERAAWGKPEPVDPDDYTITAKAGGHEEWSKTVTIKSKDKTVEIPKLQRTRSKRVKKPARPEGNPNRNLSIGLAVGGGVAILTATGFALHSRSLQDQSDKLCPGTTCADQRGVDLNGRARREGWIANIGWGLGGAAVIGAIVAWSVGGNKADRVAVAPVITGEHAGVALGGRF